MSFPKFYDHVLFNSVTTENVTLTDIKILKYLPKTNLYASISNGLSGKIKISSIQDDFDSILLYGVTFGTFQIQTKNSSDVVLETFNFTNETKDFFKIDITNKTDLNSFEITATGTADSKISTITLIKNWIALEDYFTKCEVRLQQGQKIFTKQYGGFAKVFYAIKKKYHVSYETNSENDIENILNIFRRDKGFIFSPFGFNDESREWGLREKDFIKGIVSSSMMLSLNAGMIGVGQKISFVIGEV